MSNADVLRAILHGQLPVSEGARKLSPAVRTHFKSTSRKLEVGASAEGAIVVVNAADLLPVLKSYLAGERREKEVSEWASFILMHPAYVRPELEGSVFEALWDTLADLSAPPIGQSVNHDSVSSAVARLASLPHRAA